MRLPVGGRRRPVPGLQAAAAARIAAHPLPGLPSGPARPPGPRPKSRSALGGLHPPPSGSGPAPVTGHCENEGKKGGHEGEMGWFTKCIFTDKGRQEEMLSPLMPTEYKLLTRPKNSALASQKPCSFKVQSAQWQRWHVRGQG
ncbi:DDB1- and CUL4-associated factor 1 [Manis javanica]|nr:DDB1- and CUL4-associated factor 1 [Manis javanica]